MADEGEPKESFKEILRLIAQLSLPSAPAGCGWRQRNEQATGNMHFEGRIPIAAESPIGYFDAKSPNYQRYFSQSSPVRL
jgi:hypothetical protein